jgi:dipeptidyl aminopeptidase/acylaminoacyl peptidase
MRVPALRAAGAAIFVIGSAQAASAQTVTPEMFGALPTVEEAVISPDGKTIAMLQNIGDTTAVVFFDLENPGTPPKGVRMDAAKARGIEWGSNDTLLFLVSQARKVEAGSKLETLEAWRWIAMSSETMKSTVLFGNEPGYYVLSAGRFLSMLPDDPHHVLFSRWTAGVNPSSTPSGGTRFKQKEEGGVSLFKVRLSDGDTRLVDGGNAETSYWVVNAAGEALARVDSADPKGTTDASTVRRIYTRKSGSNNLSLVRTINVSRGNASDFYIEGLSNMTGKMLATRYIGDKFAIVEFDVETGETGATVYQDPQYDLDGAVYDERIAAVRGARFTDDMPRFIHFDPQEQKVQDDLAKAIPGSAPVIVSRSSDGARYVIRVQYSDHPDQFFLFNKPARKLSMFAASYEALDGKVFAKKEKYDYTTSDGLLVPGYLTVPAGASRQSMPLIVLPHGGPWARDDQTFDWWPFFYAARGYLVYQPNFRGSDGYGANFRNAGDGEWGRKMQSDITEGVKSLIADGLVDPARVCIVGASYGGYAALAGATMTPDLYACAVSVAGVSSVGDLIGLREGASDFWQARIGSKYDRQALHDISPVFRAGNATAPILLIHGKDDTVVPIGQSRAMAKALKDSNKTVEIVELKGEDHWLSTGATRTEMLARSIAFIDKNIGPNSGAAN